MMGERALADPVVLGDQVDEHAQEEDENDEHAPRRSPWLSPFRLIRRDAFQPVPRTWGDLTGGPILVRGATGSKRPARLVADGPPLDAGSDGHRLGRPGSAAESRAASDDTVLGI